MQSRDINFVNETSGVQIHATFNTLSLVLTFCEKYIIIEGGIDGFNKNITYKKKKEKVLHSNRKHGEWFYAHESRFSTLEAKPVQSKYLI